jgi:hypothetical protein
LEAEKFDALDEKNYMFRMKKWQARTFMAALAAPRIKKPDLVITDAMLLQDGLHLWSVPLALQLGSPAGKGVSGEAAEKAAAAYKLLRRQSRRGPDKLPDPPMTGVTIATHKKGVSLVDQYSGLVLREWSWPNLLHDHGPGPGAAGGGGGGGGTSTRSGIVDEDPVPKPKDYKHHDPIQRKRQEDLEDRAMCTLCIRVEDDPGLPAAHPSGHAEKTTNKASAGGAVESGGGHTGGSSHSSSSSPLSGVPKSKCQAGRWRLCLPADRGVSVVTGGAKMADAVVAEDQAKWLAALKYRETLVRTRLQEVQAKRAEREVVQEHDYSNILTYFNCMSELRREETEVRDYVMKCY